MNIKDFAKARVRQLFELGQTLGVDILPRHFYSEIPDVKKLQGSSAWRRPFSLHAIQGTEMKDQLAFVEACTEAVAAGGSKQVHKQACALNGHDGYGTIESDFLFAFLATHRPKQVFQIGCGVSTAVIRLACEAVGYEPKITCVEPYPNEYLKQLEAAGKIELIREGAEALATSVIDALPEGTFFFVDSSHTLGPAGEVTRIIVEMLPRLKKDCWVHFHDIYFPYDYDRHVLSKSLFFSHETSLLMAFLAGNPRFSIKASLSMLHYAAPSQLAFCLPDYRPAPNADGLATGEGHFPSACYLKVE